MQKFPEATNFNLQSQKAQYAVLLSGTPALSRPIELFTQVKAVSVFICTFEFLVE